MRSEFAVSVLLLPLVPLLKIDIFFPLSCDLISHQKKRGGGGRSDAYEMQHRGDGGQMGGLKIWKICLGPIY